MPFTEGHLLGQALRPSLDRLSLCLMVAIVLSPPYKHKYVQPYIILSQYIPQNLILWDDTETIFVSVEPVWSAYHATGLYSRLITISRSCSTGASPYVVSPAPGQM